MNKLLGFIVATFSLVAISLALDPTYGVGSTLTVGITPQTVSFSPVARVASVINVGSSTVYAGINIASSDFYTSVTNGMAFPVPAHTSYTFEYPDYMPIKSVVVCSIASTNQVTVSATP